MQHIPRCRKYARGSIRLLAIFVTLILSASLAWPQASTSTVRGTVHDQGQAVIPGATVSLTNTATGVARSTTTNEAGLYVFPGTTPGSYRISAESPGLQKFEGTLTVQVQQDAVVDLTLQIAQAAVTVDVQDVTPMVRMDSPTLGHALERKRIEQLPINGRGYSQLLWTVPGVSNTGRIQAYGLRPGTHTLQFDGSSMNEVWEGWDVGRTPGLDSIEEFQVEVNNSSAKFTRPTTVILSSRSGSNQIHGAAFYTNRNSGYGVARQRQDTFIKPPYLNRNEYGVSLGGPFTIPKLYSGRNRTFFFFAWEGLKNIQNTTQRWSVPTEAMRNGDFRGLVDSQGRQFTLFDPLTTDANGRRQPLTHNGVANMIDPNRISPIAKYLFSITPLPTHPQINPLVDNNWIGPTPRLRNDETWSVRIDHRFSERDNIYGRLSRGYVDEAYQYPNQIMLNNISSVTNRWWPNTALATTWVHTFSPTFTNELILSGTRDYQRRGTGDYVTNYTSGLNLPNPFGSPNWPTMNSTGLSAPGNAGEYLFGGDGLFWLITNVASAQNNATKIMGKHEFQFGFHFRYEQINKSVVPLSGPFSFDTLATAQLDPTSTAVNPLATQFTGHNLANMYLGVANYTTQFRRPWYYMRRDEYAPYIQDNWKITPRLTLNLGLRYEYRSPISDRQDTQISFSPQHRAYVLGTDLDRFIQLGGTLPSIVNRLREYGGDIITYEQAGLPQALVNNNWNNWGPRLGFAYRAMDGAKAFVIRGGFRTSYFPTPMSQWFNNTQTTPTIVATNFVNSVSNTATSPDGLPNYGLRTVPTLFAGVNTGDNIIDLNDTRSLPRGWTASYVDPNQPDSKVYDWNFTIEKEVLSNTVVRVAYIGNKSVNLQQLVRENESVPEFIWFASRREPLPTGPYANVARRPFDQELYGTINRSAQTGFSRNNSFQVELERRYSNGFAGQFFWVTGNTLLTQGDNFDSSYYLPGTVPADEAQRNRSLNYARDINTPKHQMRWNWIADLPFGRGKKFGGNTSGVMNKLIGGWQIAGTGNWRSNYFALPTGIFPNSNPVEIYGDQYKIEDCRSGVCFPGYLWFNGYIPANQINSVGSNGRPNGIMGVPDNYKPSATPLVPWGATTAPNMPAGTNLSGFWDTNNVWIPLNNGTVQRVIYNDNNHPWRNQYFKAPNQWGLDASLFKFVNLTEKVTLRINVDMFNVLNHPNDPIAVDQSGVLTTRNSGSAARVMQLTARIMW